MPPFRIHGGRLDEARRRFPAAPTPWIDLSTGINPEPYLGPRASLAARMRLPGPGEITALEAVAAGAFGLDPAAALATPGAEAGIRLLAAAIPAARVGVAGPAYSGHGEAWRLAGAEGVEVARDALVEAAQALDVLVVVNPNNPDGAMTAPEVLVDLAERMAAHGGWLIVDEAFVEVAPQLSVASVMGETWAAPNLVALRSFGKFYGLPGVRLGFVNAHAEVIQRLRRRQGDWPVSADAIAAGLAAYDDAAWAGATRARLAEEARRLDALLVRAGFRVAGGCDLFRLAEAEDAAARFNGLAEAGILTRPFDYAPRWLRFGLPAYEHWPRLEAALMESAR